MWDLNTRETRSVELNVFEHFTPKLPAAYRETPIVLLANIAPSLQHHVLDQVKEPSFIIADTMDLWISIAKQDLLSLLERVDMLILNDGEARQLTGDTSLIRAARKIREMGPRIVAIKKGEHGCLLFGPMAASSAARPTRSRTSTIPPARVTPSRAASRLPLRRGRQRDHLRQAPQGRRPRQRARELQRREIQPRAPAHRHPDDITERYRLFQLMSHFEAI